MPKVKKAVRGCVEWLSPMGSMTRAATETHTICRAKGAERSEGASRQPQPVQRRLCEGSAGRQRRRRWKRRPRHRHLGRRAPGGQVPFRQK